jgi:enamine deaminase RidA (YjgF/YER057c/UK114 family)
MQKRAIDNPDKLPSPQFNWAVEISRFDRLLFLTGTTATGADGLINFPGDAPAQARWILESFGRLLAKAGYSFEDVVRLETTVVETVSDDATEAIRDVCVEFVGGLAVKPAAGTLRVVSRLVRPDVLVELEIVAAR